MTEIQVNQEPKPNWITAHNVYYSDDFHLYLKIRLVQIALENNPAASIRAIELLLTLNRDIVTNELAGISTDLLERGKARANAWLLQLEEESQDISESAPPDQHESGTTETADNPDSSPPNSSEDQHGTGTPSDTELLSGHSTEMDHQAPPPEDS